MPNNEEKKFQKCTSLLNKDLIISRENSNERVDKKSDKSVSYYKIIESFRRASSSDSKKIN